MSFYYGKLPAIFVSSSVMVSHLGIIIVEDIIMTSCDVQIYPFSLFGTDTRNCSTINVCVLSNISVRVCRVIRYKDEEDDVSLFFVM